MSSNTVKLAEEDDREMARLEAKLKALLPEQYHACYEDLSPVSMGSAGLKFGSDGRVAWDEIWTSFCDLALAGGPPHRGTLLQPASPDEVSAEPAKYQQVVTELGRGIFMVTGLWVQTYPAPGWIGVRCRTLAMAGWLVRAIVAENVLAHHVDTILYLPAGPGYRLEKEIKNVITAIAKGCHYWIDHVPPAQQELIAAQIADTPETRLLSPASPAEIRRQPDAYRRVMAEIAQGIQDRTGLLSRDATYAGWIGVQCPSETAAIWLMRAMIVENVLARTEGSVLFLPGHPDFENTGACQRMVNDFGRAHRLWLAQGRNTTPDSAS